MDHINKFKKCGVVYERPCADCNLSFGKRLKEHYNYCKYTGNPATAREHFSKFGHNIYPEACKIL